jgi:pimeloyl-ACP methyl ester carboxylesterase
LDRYKTAGGISVAMRKPERPADRPPLIFVHGGWHASWCWEEHFLPFFAARGFEVHAPDLRGHGSSPARNAMRWNRVSGYVDDVAEVVSGLDRPAIVIGHSLGGLVVQHAIRRELPLAGAALLATVPSYGVCKLTANTALNRPLDFLKMNLTMSLWPVVADPANAAAMFLDADASPDRIAGVCQRLSNESYLAFLDALLFDLPRTGRTVVPMTVIGGGADRVFAPASQRWTAKRYGCDCTIVDRASHDLMLSAAWPQAAERLLCWIETIRIEAVAE